MQKITNFQPASSPNTSRLGQYRERLLRLPEVLFLTGLGKSSIYASVKDGSFPAAVNVTNHAVAWRESEVNAWIATRTAAAQPDSEATPASELATSSAPTSECVPVQLAQAVATPCKPRRNAKATKAATSPKTTKTGQRAAR